MKLYATVASERATKGQGGNRFIEIELLCGDVNNQMNAGIIILDAERSNDYFTVKYIPPAGISESDAILLSEIKKIGKSQKGECSHQDSKLITGKKWLCNECNDTWIAD